MKIKDLLENLKDEDPNTEVVFQIKGFRWRSETVSIDDIDEFNQEIILMHMTEAEKGNIPEDFIKITEEEIAIINSGGELEYWKLYDRKTQ